MSTAPSADGAPNANPQASAESRDLLPTLLIGLTVTTGLVDAISVLGLGSVFTANMTGNIVFLGFAMVGTPGFSIPRSLVALAAFLIGAVGGGCLGTGRFAPSRRRWLLTVAGVESALVLVAAFFALGYDRTTREPAMSLYAMIAMTALAMGVRNATVRKLAVADLTTSVLTLALTGLAADSSLAGGTNPRWQRRLGSVIAIALGAAVGAVLVTNVGLALPLVLTAVVAVLLTIRYALHPSSTIEAHRA
jgi:uncharacterized membrane protein YoaK (UPF0700 family)